VNVGISADTAEFAVHSLRRWWEKLGCGRYDPVEGLYLTADGGGSNSYRTRAVEMGAAGAGRRARHPHQRQPLPTGHEQVESYRAPAVQLHLAQLAWPAPVRLPHGGGADRVDENRGRVAGALRA